MAKSCRTVSALMILGCVFAPMGLIFGTIGLCLLPSPVGTDGRILGLVYTPLGAAFFLAGCILLLCYAGKRRTKSRLIESGRYLWGQVERFAPNYNIRINRRHPYVAKVRCTDSSGAVHIFSSENLMCYPDPQVIGKSVRVYVGSDAYGPYYVDMEPVLSQVIEH